jgi:hypothetical protein
MLQKILAPLSRMLGASAALVSFFRASRDEPR